MCVKEYTHDPCYTADLLEHCAQKITLVLANFAILEWYKREFQERPKTKYE